MDLCFHGSPCQDFSLAGLGRGGEKDSGTRSSLLWETIRIVTKLKPKYVIWENVKSVLQSKHKKVFDKYLEALKELGYKNTYKVLNSKDFNIPQSRSRVFVISVLNGEEDFLFPEDMELKKTVFDYLEIKKEFELFEMLTVNHVKTLSKLYNEEYFENKKVSSCLTTTYPQLGHNSPTVLKYLLSEKMVNYIFSKDSKYKVSEGNLVLSRKIASTITTREGNTRADASSYYSLKLPKDFKVVEHTRIKDLEVIGVDIEKKRVGVLKIVNDYYLLRKFTPRECFRLMGFTDEDFDKAQRVNSNSQLYRQAGNSIVVPVLEEIFKKLIGD